MMGAASRRKGASAERELVAALRQAGIGAERVSPMEAAGAQKGDVEDDRGLRWQVKRRGARVVIYGWLEGFDRLAVRSDREGWLVVMRLEDYVRECGPR